MIPKIMIKNMLKVCKDNKILFTDDKLYKMLAIIDIVSDGFAKIKSEPNYFQESQSKNLIKLNKNKLKEDNVYSNKGVFSNVICNESDYKLLGNIIKEDLVANPQLMNNHQIALNVAAIYYHLYQLYAMTLDGIANKLLIQPIAQFTYDCKYRDYQSYLKGFNDVFN